VEQGGAQEAGLRAARSWADLLHQVMQPVPQRAQGHTPEMGALCTHSQWFVLFYIHSLTVLYLILVAILTWSVCLVGHSPFPFLSSCLWTLVSALGLQALIYLRFHLVSF